MLRGTVSKVMWVGRATVFLVGLAVILAVMFGVASAAFGANGGNFILGQNNAASLLTKLTGQVPGGAALQVVNTRPEAGSRGLQVSVAENRPPILVNATAGKATNLNADELDGRSEADFYAAGSKVADSEHADQADSATDAQNASDADTVDGKHASEFAAAYERTVVVSPVGTDAENGTALLNALTSIEDASASKPYLIYIEPATYNLGNSSLNMKPFVDIEGSGELNTVITSVVGNTNCSGTVNGSNNAEMRFLAVRNTGGSCSSAISNTSASPRLTHVSAEATGGGVNMAVFNTNNSSPIMTSVTATASGGLANNGVFNINNSSPTMTEVTADAAIGVSNSSGSSPTIRQSRLSGDPPPFGSPLTVDGAGTSAKVALTQLSASPTVLGGGASLQCFNNYNENMAAVNCP